MTGLEINMKKPGPPVIGITKDQQRALLKVWERDDYRIKYVYNIRSYLQFRRLVHPFIGGDCIMIPYHGMWLGIETDGHTHS